ncbi:MAG: Do family serine endopeptidase [Desulfovibrionaceae bacterium]|nr:Do family serine endopeptidase [Desulfovibrionaceae bacterium]
MQFKKVFYIVLVLLVSCSLGQLAQAGPADFSMLAAQSGQAVVNIGTEKRTTNGGPEDFFGEMFKNLPPGFDHFFGFDDFFNRQPRKRMPRRGQKSLGSGFLISADGYIVTNNHVVADADTITVTLENGQRKQESLKATLVGADEETDLALLKINPKRSLPYLEFGDSDSLRVGEWVLAIGNPFGLDHTVTAGILSAKGRDIKSGPFDNFLQTDASINPGNSGGPLLNMEGRVIGINTAIIASGQGIGFAIPSNMARGIIEKIRQGKKVQRGYLGVQIQEVDEDMAKALGLNEAHGALVGQVIAGEAAERAGLQDGDVILEVNGKSMADSAELLRTIANLAPGETVQLRVFRGGKIIPCNVTLGERPSSNQRADSGRRRGGGSSRHATVEHLGMSVRSLTNAERRKFNIRGNEGLIITAILDDQPAQEADLRVGDVILQVNMQLVGDVETLERIVKEQGLPRGVLALKIRRGESTFFRSLQLQPKN